MLKLTPVFLLFLFPFYLFSQDLEGLADYGNRADPGHELVNGKEYYPYYLRSKKKPLLFMERERTSTVTTVDGNSYNAVLHYDTYTGEIIYSVPAGAGLKTGMISLNKDFIASFTLNFSDDTLRFEHFVGPGLDEGYYEVAWREPSTFLIRHRSLVFEKNGIDEYFYHPVVYFFINGEYHMLKSSRKSGELFGEDRELIRELARKHNVNFKKPVKDNIAAMLKEYYTQKPDGEDEKNF